MRYHVEYNSEFGGWERASGDKAYKGIAQPATGFTSRSLAILYLDARATYHDKPPEKYRVVEDDTKDDMIKSPPHYARLNPQPRDVIRTWNLNFNLGSAVKYVARAGFKEGETPVKDLQKAVDFIEAEIRALESK